MSTTIENESLANENSSFMHDFWDSSLKEIKPEEELWYKIYDKLKEVPHGGQFSLENVFKMPCSTDEYFEFIKYSMWCSGPDTFNSEEEFRTSLKNPEDNVAFYKKIAYWYLYNQNFIESTRWFEKAAEQNDSEAITRLAGAYANGCGTETNIEKALLLYKKAIQIDAYPDALMDLALIYIHGIGIPTNKERAFFLMERAAKQGSKASQYNLGTMYKTGTGVSLNIGKALYWYHLSADQGYEQAITELFNYYMSIQNYEYAEKMILLGIHFDIEEYKNIREELIRLSNQNTNQ